MLSNIVGIFLIGEIIHNPEVNRQLVAMGIQTLEWREADESYLQLGPDDVVITNGTTEALALALRGQHGLLGPAAVVGHDGAGAGQDALGGTGFC